MALYEARPCLRLIANHKRTCASLLPTQCRQRNASTAAALAESTPDDAQELELASSFAPAPSSEPFDPLERSKSRPKRLPPSRYAFRPPRYNRGPLHPHQSPRRADPVSREFIPGPFTLPRLSQTYDSTTAPDLMTLAYQHTPPGQQPTGAGPSPPRLRTWDDSSPYHKGRPTRKPRGGDTLRPLRRPINFRNVPRLEGVTVHCFVNAAAGSAGSAALHVAGMALQAVTGARATPIQARKNINQWGMRQGKYVAVKADLKGEDMYNFLGKLVDVVMPRIKEWAGVSGSSGDDSGNIAFGMTPEEVAYFPEIEVNYDSYPPKLIPGCHVIIRTTAAEDRDGRLLLSSLGIPFHGKQVN